MSEEQTKNSQSTPPSQPVEDARTKLAREVRQRPWLKWLAIGVGAVVALAILGAIASNRPSQDNPSALNTADPIAIENYLLSLQPKPFTDVSSDHDNYAAVSYLAREQIVSASPDGNFNPDQFLTRSEWAGMLTRLTGIEPSQDIYQNCFPDVSTGEVAAAICFVKEEGWLEAIPSETQTWSPFIIRAVQAQSDDEPFNPDQPIKDTEAVGSLARMMRWATSGVPLDDEQAANLARQFDLFESVGDSITRGQASELVFRSLATVSLGQERYQPVMTRVVERYTAPGLWNSMKAAQQAELNDPDQWEARKSTVAENFADFGGVSLETAQSIVNRSASPDEATRNLRAYRAHTQWLLDYTDGEVIKPEGLAQEVNFLDAVQTFTTRRGGNQTLDRDDVLMLQRTLQSEDWRFEPTNNPALQKGRDVRILIVLDDNYQMLTRNHWGNGEHVLQLEAGDLWVWDGYLNGDVRASVWNMRAGVWENNDISTRGSYERDLADLIHEAMLNLEPRIGHRIEPPASQNEDAVSQQSEDIGTDLPDDFGIYDDTIEPTGYGRPADSVPGGCKAHWIGKSSKGYKPRCFVNSTESYWFHQVQRTDHDGISLLNHPLSEAEVHRVGELMKARQAEACASNPTYCDDIIPGGFESIKHLVPSPPPPPTIDPSIEAYNRWEECVSPLEMYEDSSHCDAIYDDLVPANDATSEPSTDANSPSAGSLQTR